MNNNTNMDFSNLVNNLKSGNIPEDIKNKITPEMLSNFANMFNNMNSNSTNSSSSIHDNNNFEDSSSSNNNFETNSESGNNFNNFFGGSEQSNNSSNFNIDMDMLFKMKNVFDKMNNTKDDPRANLLLSLKPYLKESRKEKVEQYVKLFSMGKIIEVFNSKRW